VTRVRPQQWVDRNHKLESRPHKDAATESDLQSGKPDQQCRTAVTKQPIAQHRKSFASKFACRVPIVLNFFPKHIMKEKHKSVSF